MGFDFNGWLGAWDRHDGPAMASYFTRDATYQDMTLARHLEGPAEIAAFVAETEAEFSSDFRLELLSAKESPEGYVLEWRWTGTHDRSSTQPPVEATGRRFDLLGVSVGELEGGKIRANRDYWNALAFLMQVGLQVPEVEPAA